MNIHALTTAAAAAAAISFLIFPCDLCHGVHEKHSLILNFGNLAIKVSLFGYI